MDKTLSEVFGEFTYSQTLTYFDLLAQEQELLEQLDQIFLNNGAEYLDFTPLGDILKLQCSFESQDLDIFRDLASKVSAILPPRVKGRLFCLEKNLASYHIFWLRKGQWQEQNIVLPVNAPEDLPIHKE